VELKGGTNRAEECGVCIYSIGRERGGGRKKSVFGESECKARVAKN